MWEYLNFISSTGGVLKYRKFSRPLRLYNMPKDVEKGKSVVETIEENPTPKTSPSLQHPGNEAPTEKKPILLRVIRFLQDQWFLITLAILIAIASQHQVPKEHQKLKTTIVAYLCVSIIFFLTGCTLKTQVLIDNYTRWKIHLFVQIQSFFVTSAIMFGVVAAAGTKKDFMDPGLLVGMILTGCVATTISSNVVMTGQAKGNQALTVVESTIGNFLGPFLTPALFKGVLANFLVIFLFQLELIVCKLIQARGLGIQKFYLWNPVDTTHFTDGCSSNLACPSLFQWWATPHSCEIIWH